MRKDSDVCKIAILDNTAVFVKCQCCFEEKKLSFCASGVLSSVLYRLTKVSSFLVQIVVAYVIHSKGNIQCWESYFGQLVEVARLLQVMGDGT